MALDFFAGCVGGCAGVLVGHPFDTIKVRLQTQDAAKPLYSGTMDCLRKTLANEKVTGLYKGVTSPLCGVAFVNAIVFGVYGAVLRLQSDPNRASSQMMAGAIAGAAQSIVCGPVELAKTRLQLQTGETSTGRVSTSASHTSSCKGGSTAKPMGPLQCLIQIARSEGIRGVFRGLGATVAREVPGCSLYFVSYELLSRPSGNENGVTQPISTARMLTAGGLAGTISWVAVYPIDVVKSRIQADGHNSTRKYRGAIDCFRQSLSSEGAIFMVRGLTSTVLRAFPTNAATFTVIGWVFRVLGSSPASDSSATSTASTKPSTTLNSTSISMSESTPVSIPVSTPVLTSVSTPVHKPVHHAPPTMSSVQQR